MMTYVSSIGGFFKMDGRDPYYNQIRNGAGLDWMGLDGKVNGWMDDWYRL